MLRFAPGVVALLLAGVPARAQPAPPVPPPAEVAPPTAAQAVNYAPGDGVTVSLLDGTSRLKLFGQFSTIAAATTDRGFPPGGPLFLVTPPLNGNRTNTFDIHARQTGFGAIFTGPEVLGFTPGATAVGFIQNDDLTSDAYGFLPFNAYAELKNDDWRFAAGLMSDVFNPLNPNVISLLRLYTSGNTGSFAGAIRGERFWRPAPAFQLTTQVAVRQPIGSVVTSNQRLLEDDGWPNVEARVAAGVGEPTDRAGGRKLRPVEVGVSGVVGRLRNGAIGLQFDPNVIARSTVSVWGVGADAQVAVTERCGFLGEVYAGQGLGEYNGGIGQTFGRNLGVVRTAGGFGEVYCYFTDRLHLHTGYGIDAPLRRDLSPGQLRRNQTYFANLVWDATRSLQLSFEVDYRRTDYAGLLDARGVVFIGQFLLKF